MGNTRYYTKANGQSYAELTYDAWGMPESPNKLLNNDHGNYVYATYTGHIFDTTLDIYFAEARFYDANTRTWLAMDPIKDGDNWYQYCYCNPVVYIDHDGRIVLTTVGAVAAKMGVGFLVSAGISAASQVYNPADGSFSLKNIKLKDVLIDGAVGAVSSLIPGVAEAKNASEGAKFVAKVVGTTMVATTGQMIKNYTNHEPISKNIGWAIGGNLLGVSFGTMYVPDAAIANLKNAEALKTAAQLLGSGLLTSVYTGAAMDIAYSDVRNGIGIYKNTTESVDINSFYRLNEHQFILRKDITDYMLQKNQIGFSTYVGSAG